MTTPAFLLIVAAAFAHATWNLLLKQSGTKTAFMWGFTVFSFAFFLVPSSVVVALEGLPLTGVGFALVSAVLHGSYGLMLTRAYDLGDLSAAYPVARGMGVALIPLGGVLILGESVSPAAAVAIGLVVVGIVAVQVQARSLAEVLQPLQALARPAGRTAIITGIFIATYSVWDKAALDHIEPLPFHQITMTGYLVMLAPATFANGAAALRNEWRRRRWAFFVAGVLTPLGYVLVLTALTTSRVAYIGPAREMGIVLGAIMGVVLLREGFGVPRVGGALLIVAGAFTLGLAP